MATLLHSFSATSKTWVEKRIVVPFSAAMVLKVSRMDFVAMGSRPTKGSSKTMSLGSWIMAAIRASFCCMPWL